MPGDFELAVNSKNFLWLRKDNREITASIVIKSFPYKDKSQMELEGTAIAQASSRADGKEGVAAFLDKRAAKFSGV